MIKQNIVKKAIIPVAGLGTRFLPATKAQPKEMLPIIDKPVIHYIVEEAVNSGIETIIFITGRHKRAIEDYFDYSPELENKLLQKNQHHILSKIREICHLANFIYVRQKLPLGDGDAILQAEKLIGDEPVAILFGDDIVDSKIPALLQLIKVYEKYNDCVVALTKVSKKEVSLYGNVEAIKIDKNVYEIKNIVQKPKPEEALSNLAIVGKYIITPEIFKELRNIPQEKDKEINLTSALKNLLAKRPVYGVEIEGKRYDCGSKIGLLKAIIDFGLKHPEVKRGCKNYLKKIKI